MIYHSVAASCQDVGWLQGNERKGRTFLRKPVKFSFFFFFILGLNIFLVFAEKAFEMPMSIDGSNFN